MDPQTDAWTDGRDKMKLSQTMAVARFQQIMSQMKGTSNKCVLPPSNTQILCWPASNACSSSCGIKFTFLQY
eukprot:scaffold264443_cov34-Prasinocladus_malaysianus.AAC.1